VVLTASTETRDDLFSKVVTIQSGLVADFSFPNEDYFAPCEITFTNKSEGAESYLWDFGNGETSAEKNPTSTFQTPGDYTVTLTVYADSEETTTSKNITILENPNPLLGKWNLVSGTFNGVNIPNLTGYRIFGDEDISGANWTGDSKCHMKHGNDRGTVYGAYEISGESLIYGHNMTIISWITNQTNFSKFGVVGLGLQDVDYLIDGENLIITGVNNHGTTVLTYEKD
jgi:PKD repeat protein